jgi:hypothetical protein
MTTTDDLVQHTDNVHESIRALNHITIDTRSLPAPVVYQMLGNLNNAGYGLAQLLGQLSNNLIRSLADYDVYDNAGDPTEAVGAASAAMRQAADLARQIGTLLSSAQSAINQQGYNTPDQAAQLEDDDEDWDYVERADEAGRITVERPEDQP